jgi:hypothetical protein
MAGELPNDLPVKGKVGSMIAADRLKIFFHEVNRLIAHGIQNSRLPMVMMK